MEGSKNHFVKSILLPFIIAAASGFGGWFTSYMTLKVAQVETGSDRETKYLESIILESEKLRDLVGEKDKEISDWHKTVRETQEELEVMRETLAKLEASEMPKDSVQLIELIMNEMPYPAWLHEVGKNNWYLNDSYAKKFGVNRANFWTPINILRRYPSEVSASYLSNDMHVIEARKGGIFKEKVTRNVLFPESFNNPSEEWSVLKVPMIVEGKSYIFGACINGDTPDNIFDKYRIGSNG